MSDTLDRLCDLVRERALKMGDFTLASGKKSTYYLDGKQVTLHAGGLRLVAEAMLEATEDLAFDAIGGMVIGADPIVGGVLAVAAEQGRDLDGFLVRKEAKGHGTQKYVEGPLSPGAKVLIVEDVVTTGGSSLKAIERVEDFGAEVVGVTAIVDRMQGGAEAFAARGIAFKPLLSITDFGIDPPAEDG